MQDSEYEERRRALEKQYAEDLELIRTAHLARLRALEALRQAPGRTQPPAAVADRMPPTARKADPRVPRRDLRQAIQDVLPQLTEVFDRHQLEKALGFEPPRSTLVRILREMWADKELAIESYSSGRTVTKYRKLAKSQAEAPAHS
jgi:hypothetical protein